MPRTQATTTPAPPVFPPGRYGRRREPRRPRRGVATAALVAVLVAGVALAFDLYRRYGDPSYEAQVVSYTGATADQITIRFRLDRAPQRGAVCAVRARARDGAVVGRAEVRVPPGATEVTYRLTTTSLGFVGEVLRCRPPG